MFNDVTLHGKHILTGSTIIIFQFRCFERRNVLVKFWWIISEDGIDSRWPHLENHEVIATLYYVITCYRPQKKHLPYLYKRSIMRLGENEIGRYMRLVVLPLFKDWNATELFSVVCLEDV